MKVTMNKLPEPRPDHTATRAPKSEWAKFIWRQKMWFDTTFGLSVMETWEYSLLWIIWALLFTLVLFAVVRILPQQLALIQRRAIYYLYGHEGRPDERWIDTVRAGVVAGAELYKEL